jgi:hypothetical protein
LRIRWFARAVALVIVAAVALAGCGAAGGPVNDPAGSVTNALSAMTSGGLSKVSEFACAAHKDDVANAFAGGNTAALTAAGLKPDDVFNAMTLSFANVSAKEVSKSGDKAVVHVTADMKVAFDKDKFKVLLKTVLAGQGQPTDDATLEAAMNMMSGQLEQTQHMDEDVDVVNEGGKWLICE